MKPDETPAPSEGICRIPGTIPEPHNWVISYRGKMRRCRWCGKTEWIPEKDRTPIQSGEQISNDSSGVEDATAGAVETKPLVNTGTRTGHAAIKAHGELDAKPDSESSASPAVTHSTPSAGEVTTEAPRTDAEAERISNLPIHQWPIEWKMFARQLECELTETSKAQCKPISLDYYRMECQRLLFQNDAAIERAEKAERERDGYQEMANSQFNTAEKYLAQLSTLRKAVEEAPHEENCQIRSSFFNESAQMLVKLPCNCWKSRALNAEGGI